MFELAYLNSVDVHEWADFLYLSREITADPLPLSIEGKICYHFLKERHKKNSEWSWSRCGWKEFFLTRAYVEYPVLKGMT